MLSHASALQDHKRVLIEGGGSPAFTFEYPLRASIRASSFSSAAASLSSNKHQSRRMGRF